MYKLKKLLPNILKESDLFVELFAIEKSDEMKVDSEGTVRKQKNTSDEFIVQ